jgi:hypothetical protein
VGAGGVGAGGFGAGGEPGGGALPNGGAPASLLSSLPPHAASAVAANNAAKPATSRLASRCSAAFGGDSINGGDASVAAAPSAGAAFSSFIDCSLPSAHRTVTQSTLSSRCVGRFVAV